MIFLLHNGKTKKRKIEVRRLVKLGGSWKSRTAWSKLGRDISPGVIPRDYFRYMVNYDTYSDAVYSMDQTYAITRVDHPLLRNLNQ